MRRPCPGRWPLPSRRFLDRMLERHAHSLEGAVNAYPQRRQAHRSCGLSGGESVQPRAPNGLGRAGPRRTRPRVATRILCVVRAREASSLTTWPDGYGQGRRGGPEPSSGGTGAPHADAAPGVPGRTTTLTRTAQGTASPQADDHTIELIRPCTHSLASSSNPYRHGHVLCVGGATACPRTPRATRTRITPPSPRRPARAASGWRGPRNIPRPGAGTRIRLSPL
jgi:hypothetical protein